MGLILQACFSEGGRKSQAFRRNSLLQDSSWDLTNLRLQPITPARCRSRPCSAIQDCSCRHPSATVLRPSPGPSPLLFMGVGWGGGAGGKSLHPLPSTPGRSSHQLLSPERECGNTPVCLSAGRTGGRVRTHLQIDSAAQTTPCLVHLLQSPAWRPSLLVPGRTLALSRGVQGESRVHGAKGRRHSCKAASVP